MKKKTTLSGGTIASIVFYVIFILGGLALLIVPKFLPLEEGQLQEFTMKANFYSLGLIIPGSTFISFIAFNTDSLKETGTKVICVIFNLLILVGLYFLFVFGLLPKELELINNKITSSNFVVITMLVCALIMIILYIIYDASCCFGGPYLITLLVSPIATNLILIIVYWFSAKVIPWFRGLKHPWLVLIIFVVVLLIIVSIIVKAITDPDSFNTHETPESSWYDDDDTEETEERLYIDDGGTERDLTPIGWNDYKDDSGNIWHSDDGGNTVYRDDDD